MRKIVVAVFGLMLLAGAQDVSAQERERSQEGMKIRTRELPAMLRSQGGSGWLGFSYDVVIRRRLPREDSAHVRTPAEAVVVKEVRPRSPAEKAGVMSGDTIVSLNGLTTNERLVSSLATFLEPGDTVRLRVRRTGTEREFKLVAEPRPNEFTFRRRCVSLDDSPGRCEFPDSMVFDSGDPGPRQFSILEGDSIRSMMRLFLDSARIRLDTLNFPHMRVERMEDLEPMKHSFAYAFDVGSRAIAGAELQDLTPELGEYFGVSHGVLVLRVGKGTPAAEAGLVAGDVITKANAAAINRIDQLRRAISVRNKEPVKLQVLRRKKPITIQLKGDR